MKVVQRESVEFPYRVLTIGARMRERVGEEGGIRGPPRVTTEESRFKPKTVSSSLFQDQLEVLSFLPSKTVHAAYQRNVLD